MTLDDDELEPGEDFQRIRERIRRTLSLPIGRVPSGAKTDPAGEISSKLKGADDLVWVFRRMLGISDNDLYNDYRPTEDEPLYYQDTEEGKQWAEWAYGEYLKHNPDLPEARARAEAKTDTGLSVTDIVAKIRAEREAADRANEAELAAANANNKQESRPFDFQCYHPKCGFATNDKAIYERHCVTKHPGKPGYPGKVDLRLYGWEPQGRKWEV